MISKMTGRFVIGFDGHDHVIYRNGEVVYAGDTIIHVGHGYAGQVDQVIDAGEAVISPGFIDMDALSDIDHAILDCWGGPERSRNLQWSEDYFSHRRREVFSREEEAFKRRFALTQLIAHGITTAMPIAAETYKEWAETYDEFADIVDIIGDLGIRMYLGPSYRAGINVLRANGQPDVMWDEARGWEGLRQAVQFIHDFDGAHGGLVHGCLLPCRIETCTPALLRRTKQVGDELNCLVRLHAAQGPQEVRFLRSWYDRRPVEWLHELGFLGPRTLIPHCKYVRGEGQVNDSGLDELALLAETGTTVIHCPMVLARYGTVLYSFDRYRRAGVNLALGTDTFPPDMLRVMDYGSNLARIAEGDKTAGAAADLFRAATLGGARALGRDDLGRLAQGAKADIIIIDLAPLRVGMIADPIWTLLFNASGANVRTVIINGRPVMRDGVIPGVDVAAMRQRTQDYFEKLQAAYPERASAQVTQAELFPPSFRSVG